MISGGEIQSASLEFRGNTYLFSDESGDGYFDVTGVDRVSVKVKNGDAYRTLSKSEVASLMEKVGLNPTNQYQLEDEGRNTLSDYFYLLEGWANQGVDEDGNIQIPYGSQESIIAKLCNGFTRSLHCANLNQDFFDRLILSPERRGELKKEQEAKRLVAGKRYLAEARLLLDQFEAFKTEQELLLWYSTQQNYPPSTSVEKKLVKVTELLPSSYQTEERRQLEERLAKVRVKERDLEAELAQYQKERETSRLKISELFNQLPSSLTRIQQSDQGDFVYTNFSGESYAVAEQSYDNAKIWDEFSQKLASAHAQLVTHLKQFPEDADDPLMKEKQKIFPKLTYPEKFYCTGDGCSTWGIHNAPILVGPLLVNEDGLYRANPYANWPKHGKEGGGLIVGAANYLAKWVLEMVR
ncbi:MAG: hypothetical protein Q7S68_04905 [Deltaproteobacteria bacterium]|nr:hypothetical protein [Deltaproteobacteria bacterium]